MIDRIRTVGALGALLSALALAACGPVEPGIARGEAVWDTCTPCHGENGEGNQVLGAPAIAGLPQWYVQAQLEKFSSGLRGTHPMDTVGIRMKSMSLSLDLDGDLESVATYVASLSAMDPAPTLGGGNAQAGETAFSTSVGGGLACVGCHMQGALGLEATGAPPLVGQHDWYLLAQFEKFQNGWRGANPADPMAGQMATASQNYTREQVINIIAYLETLPPLPPPAATEDDQ